MKSTTRLTLAVIAAILLAIPSFGQNYRLSSHILDIDAGVPASGVKITLEKMNPDSTWSFVDQKTTDENGRVKDFLEEGTVTATVYTGSPTMSSLISREKASRPSTRSSKSLSK